MANDRKNYDDLLGGFEPQQKKTQRRTVTPPTGVNRVKPSAPPPVNPPRKYEDISSDSSERKSYRNGVYFSYSRGSSNEQIINVKTPAI
jgi:hypothetical protein